MLTIRVHELTKKSHKLETNVSESGRSCGIAAVSLSLATKPGFG